MLNGWLAETSLTNPSAPEKVVVVAWEQRQDLLPEVVVTPELLSIAQD